MAQTLVVECKYSWGQMLRLYSERLDLNGISYPLYDLVRFWPVYRRILHFSVLSLELQFHHELVTVHGITDVEAGLQVTLYLNRWLNKHAQPAQEDDVILMPAHVVDSSDGLTDVSAYTQSPAPLAYSVVIESQRRPQHDNPSDRDLTTNSTPDTPTDERGGESSPETSAEPCESKIEAAAGDIWSVERQRQRQRRLVSLQTDRELRFYGFDVAALKDRLSLDGLPVIHVSLPLQHDELAHYCTNALLCDELPSRKHKPRKVRDKGQLILTNRRTIFQGRKRQLVLLHNRISQISYLPDAIMLYAEYWSRQQFFVMARPLECAIYFEHVLCDVRQQQRQLYLQGPESQ